jgi:hypothetical protein
VDKWLQCPECGKKFKEGEYCDCGTKLEEWTYVCGESFPVEKLNHNYKGVIP